VQNMGIWSRDFRCLVLATDLLRDNGSGHEWVTRDLGKVVWSVNDMEYDHSTGPCRAAEISSSIFAAIYVYQQYTTTCSYFTDTHNVAKHSAYIYS
jgi:hypothetical protein